MWPFDDIGETLGGPIKDMIATGFEATMAALWKASLFMLQAAFGLADQFSVFTVDTRTGPISILWPLMLWISGVLALGLFFWQLTVTTLRGGRGFVRLVVGPVQYGVALAVTVGIVAAFLAGVDGVTEGILKYGLNASNFTDALNATGFLDAAGDGVNGVVLGIAALIGVIPAALGYVLEMLFREAAIYVIVATIPVNAAGLLAGVTSSWFWRSARWGAVCIVMKPVLAMSLVLGIAISGGSQGLSGLLAGIGVLIISLFCPFVLFRLFAFIDPNSDAGAAFRNALSGVGVDSYGANNPAAIAGRSLSGGGGGSEAMEDANNDRYDGAAADDANNEMDNTGTGQSSGGGSSGSGQDPDNGANTNSGNGSGSGADPADDNGAATPPPANSGSVVSSSPTSGPSGDYGTDSTSGGTDPSGPGSSPTPPDNGGGASGGAKSSGGGGGAAAGAEEAAVIV